MRIQPWTEAQLMQREDVFEALVSKAVKQTMRKTAAQLRSGVLTAAVELPPPPPETAPPVSFTAFQNAVLATWAGYVDTELFPFLTDTFVSSAERVVGAVGAATEEVLTNTYAQEFLAYAYNRMVGTGQQLWEQIRDELSAGFAAGEGIREIAARLQDVAQLSLPRALTVARTEVISAANAGSYLQMIDLGLEAQKVWLATEDARTRISHRHADNQSVQLTDEFSLDIYNGDVKTGTEFVEFPGDPTGTPGNVINCRCSLAFDFDEDEEEDVFTAAQWIETKHPRDNDGKFKKKGAPDLVDLDTDTDAPRPTGGVVTKTGKAWTPGQPVAMKVQFLFNTSFKDGAVMAVRKDSDERIVWDGKKIQRQKKGADGKYATTETLTRGAFMAKYKDEDGWTIPDSADAAPSAPSAPTVAPGKPIALKVQVLYNTKYAAGDTIAERVGSNERLVWNGKKVERQTWDGSSWNTTETLTRGAAYKAYKDEDGWTTPTGAVGGTPAPAAAPALAPAPAVVPKAAPVTPQAVLSEGNIVTEDHVDAFKDVFHHPDTITDDLLFENDDITVEKFTDSSIKVVSKHDTTYDAVYDIDEVGADTLNDFADLAPQAPAPAPVVLPLPDPALFSGQAPALAVSKDKAATIKGWAKHKDIIAGELHNGPNFKIVKGAQGTIIIYPKGPDGYAVTSAGSAQVLFGDEITAQGIQDAVAKLPAPTAPAAANLAVTGKTLTPSVAPQQPLKLSYSVLVNPKTTKYTDGQVIAENPGEGERLVWNGKTKKYNIQVQDSAGNWVFQHAYTKQGAYKNLKDDAGWVTPSAASAPAPTAPSVAGVPAPTATAAKTTAVKQPKFTTVELKAAADHKVSALSDTQVANIYKSFREKGKGSYDVVRLTSPGEDVLEAVLRAQEKHHKDNPGSTLNMLEIIRAVDLQAAKDAGAPNKNLYEQKLVDWLSSPIGKQAAPEVLHNFRLSPAEKAKIEADKKSAAAQALAAKLKSFHDIPLSKPSTTSTDFPNFNTTQAQQMQDKMLASAPWTGAQKAALKKYSGSYYHSMNGMLRGTTPPNDTLIADVTEAQKGMRPLAEDMLLYRGTAAIAGMLPSNISAYAGMIGQTFQDKGFTSTSINNPFGGKIKLEIEAPKGTPAAYIKSISSHPTENEVLLAAGTKFKILSAQENFGTIVVRVRVVS